MKAAQVVEFGKPYQLNTVAIPDVKDDELLVKIHAAGFCHSDLQVLSGQFGTKLPIVSIQGLILDLPSKTVWCSNMR
ncbi:hypothetical protein ANO14919_082480 [Xylariales sp. No.14919]|nr:hypothetical protein ANO14919_082480 [Xylariales sp. No.14919]